MGRIVVSTFVTLDGVMQAPGGDFHPDGKAGWNLRYFSNDMGKYALDSLQGTDALLLGRVTYDGFAASWPTIKDEEGFADRMNALPKYVVSTTLQHGSWNNTTVIKEGIGEEVTALKKRHQRDIVVMGGADLIYTLTREGLIDEYRLWVHPVILGSGKHIFREGAPMLDLKFKESRTFDSGVIVLIYERP